MRLRIAVDLRPLLEGFESGVNVYATRMLSELLKNTEIEAIPFYQSAAPSEKIHEMFPTTIYIPISNSLFHLKSILKFPDLPDNYFPRKPDLIWIPDRRPFYKTAIPIVITIHDFVPELYPRTLSLKSRIWHKVFSVNRLKKMSKGVLVPSLTTVSGLGLDSPPFEITYEGAVLAHESRAPQCAKKIKSQAFFLMISPADPRKGYKKIYKLAKFFPHANFVIAGYKRGDKRFSFMRKSNKYKNIVVLNEISEEEKLWLLKNATALLALSVYEGFDLPVMEAIKAKCPVILSDISVHRELYKSNYFVKSEEDLLLAVKKNLMGYGQVPAMRGEYNWESAAKRALLFFLRIIGNENRKASGYGDGDYHA